MIKNYFANDYFYSSRWWKDVTTYFYSGVKNAGICDAVGFMSALFLIISYLMLTCSRSKLGHAPASVLYSLIGDLCHLAGAFLSNQTFFQCVMASLMATLDAVHFMAVTLPLCWWYHSTSGRRVRMLSRRRRQNVLVVCLLSVMGGCVYANISVCYVKAVSYGSTTSRKLLNVIVHDQTELLGFVLGLLSFTIYWTSRIPIFLKANRGAMSNLVHLSSRGCSALAGALYASAILLYDPQLESVIKALPWVLSGVCWAIMDLSILLLSCYRICNKWSSGTLGSDTEALLGRFHRVTSGLYHTPKDKNARKHISSWKNSSSKMPEIGPRNTNVQPVQKVCLKEVTITQQDSAQSQPLKECVKVVRVDESYSSGSATDASCLSSELEWDFEETPPQWSSQNGNRHKMDVFPLPKWTVDPQSNVRSSSRAGFR